MIAAVIQVLLAIRLGTGEESDVLDWSVFRPNKIIGILFPLPTKTDMASEINIKKLRDILSRVGSVKSLTEASVRLAKIDRLLKTVLPSLLADYCRVKSCSTRELTIEAYSQAVATHLRFSAPKLLERLQKQPELSKIDQITIKVGTLAQVALPNTVKRKPNIVSAENCRLLHLTAESIQSQELKASLERLATTLDKHRKKKPPL